MKSTISSVSSLQWAAPCLSSEGQAGSSGANQVPLEEGAISVCGFFMAIGVGNKKKLGNRTGVGAFG